MKSSELLALADLKGWRLAVGYWLQLAHGLNGVFPALLYEEKSEEGEAFICLDEATIGKVAELLPTRRFKILKELFFINQANTIAFSVFALSDHWKTVQELNAVVVLTMPDIESAQNRKACFRTYR